MKKTRLNKSATLLFAVVFVFVLSFGAAGTALAGVGPTTVMVNGDYELESDNLILNVVGPSRIYSDGTEYFSVFINCNKGADLTLENVQINNIGPGGYVVDFAGDVQYPSEDNELEILGTTTLSSGSGNAAIRVVSPVKLTITGDGTLNATGDKYGAGIGGGDGESSGTIVINMTGTINAWGGEEAAGIGGGDGGSEVDGEGDSVSITIDAGTVNAYGGEDAAAIGSGDHGDNGEITINGGTVNALRHSANTDDDDGAGIGSGQDGNGGTIVIAGGVVNAQGGVYGAGIGTGYDSTNGTITISGGKVTATGGEDGAGIGGGSYSDGGVITITEGTVYAWSEDGAGIGGGANDDSNDVIGSVTINISGGKVTARALGSGAAIGTGEYAGGVSEINISGSAEIDAQSDDYGAAIGYGDYAMDGSITINISGGTTTAWTAYDDGNGDGAGIGSGDEPSGNGPSNGVINISGGWVDAWSEYGSGIGCGEENYWGTVNITGGVVNGCSESYDDIGEGSIDGSISSVNISGSAIVIPYYDYVYKYQNDSSLANFGTHVRVEAELYEGGVLIPEFKEIVLLNYDGISAPTWNGYDYDDDQDAFVAYYPQNSGAYYLTKDDGELRTQDYIVEDVDTQETLDFVSVLLDGIDISEGTLTPAFNSTTIEYDVAVGNDIDSVNIRPTAHELGDTITVNGDAVASDAYSDEIALSVGENIIEIVVTDETKTDVSQKYIVNVYREYGDAPDVSGTLLDSSGAPLVGWTVILESDPVTVVTDGLGQFSFTNVALEDHTLTIKNTGGDVIATYQIVFTPAGSFAWRIAQGTIFIDITSQTAGVDIEIEVGEGASIENVTERIGNPDTGDSASFTWLWIALAAMLLAVGTVVLKKSLNR